MTSPSCTRGAVEPDGPGAFARICGCGDRQGGFPSRSQAKLAQREHRYPLTTVRPEQTDRPRRRPAAPRQDRG